MAIIRILVNHGDWYKLVRKRSQHRLRLFSPGFLFPVQLSCLTTIFFASYIFLFAPFFPFFSLWSLSSHFHLWSKVIKRKVSGSGHATGPLIDSKANQWKGKRRKKKKVVRSFGRKPFGRKPFGWKPFSWKPFGWKPFGIEPFDQMPSCQMPPCQIPTCQKQLGLKPTSPKPFDWERPLRIVVLS